MDPRAVIERAKIVIVEPNRNIPYVFGAENGVHMSEVNYIIEGDHQPCPMLPNPEPSEIDRAVAQRIAAEVPDGACLQIGIGEMPNAVCSLLLDAGVKDLGVHTEMLTDGIGLLYRPGRVMGAHKTQSCLHVRAWLAGVLCDGKSQPRFFLPSG